MVIAGPAEGGIKRHLAGLTGRSRAGRPDFRVIGPGRLPSPAKVARTLAWPGEKAGFDVINAHGYRAGMVALVARGLTARLARRPVPPLVLTMHGFPPGGPAGWLCRAVVRRSAMVIAVSSALARRAIQLGASPRDVRVIPNGVDLASFRAIPALSSEAADRRPLVVGVLARLAREKGLQVLLPAVARVARVCPGLRVLIAGDGPQRNRLERLAGRLGLGKVVRFLGRVEDVPAFLAGVDILAAPSLSEGQSLAVIEAMAAGRPVVASAVGGLVELVEEGRTGVLVRPGDPAELARGLLRLGGDPGLRAAMGMAARAVAATRFDLEEAVADLDRALRAAAGRPPSPPAGGKGASRGMGRPRGPFRPEWLVWLGAGAVIVVVLATPLTVGGRSPVPVLPRVEPGSGVFLLTLDQSDLGDWRRPGLATLPAVVGRGVIGLMNSRTGRDPDPHSSGGTGAAAYYTLGSGSRAVGGGGEDIKAVATENGRLNHPVSVGLLGQRLRANGVLTVAAAGAGQAGPTANARSLCMDGAGQIDVVADLRSLPGGLDQWRAAGLRYLVVFDFPGGPDGLVQGDTTLERVLALAGDDPVMVVSPSPPPSEAAADRELVPLAILGQGRTGAVTSPTTRRTGLVANIDLAPTLLEAYGLDATGASGRGMTIVASGRDWPLRAGRLGDDQGRLQGERFPLVRMYIAEQVIVGLAALAVLWGPTAWRRDRTVALIEVGLLTLGLYPPVSLLLGLAGPHGPVIDGGLALGLSAGIGFILARAGRGALRGTVWVGAAASAIALGDILLGGPLAYRSAIGYSLVSGARYYGIGNEYMGVLVGSSLVGLAALGRAGRCRSGPVGRTTLILAGLACVAALGAPWAGANLGGAMTAAAGYAYLATVRRPPSELGSATRTARRRDVFPAAVVAATALVTAAVALGVDALQPPGRQSHLGLLVESVRRSGTSALFPVFLRKLAMNLRLIRYTVWSRVLLASFAAYLILLFRPRGMVGRVLRDDPSTRQGLAAASLAALVALAVNDSGVVAAGTLMIYPGVALLGLLLAEAKTVARAGKSRG